MSNFMKSKPLVAAMMTGGMLLGGFGTLTAVSAQTTDDEAPSTDTQDDRSDRDGRKGKGCGKSLDAAAEAIGIEADELKAAIEEGQTIAEVAEANGVDVDTVVDAMVAEVETKLDAKVEAERLTEDEAADKLAAKTERIEARVAGEDVSDNARADDDRADDDSADADSADEAADDDAVEGEGS